jgi:hypothetical protein
MFCPYFPTVLCVSPILIMLRVSREIKGVGKTLSSGARPLTTILKHLKLVFCTKTEDIKKLLETLLSGILCLVADSLKYPGFSKEGEMLARTVWHVSEE